MQPTREALAVWRCPSCSRILAKLRLAAGSVVEVKCASCGSFSLREAPIPDTSATLASKT